MRTSNSLPWVGILRLFLLAPFSISAAAISFGPPTIIEPGYHNANASILLAELTGDNRPDLVWLNALNNSSFATLTNDGAGGFAVAGQYTTPGSFPPFRSFGSGDFNKDGATDLFLWTSAYLDGGEETNYYSIFLGDGRGSFTNRLDVDFGTSRYYFQASGDFNGDTVPDLAFRSVTPLGNYEYDEKLVIVLGTGNASFGAHVTNDLKCFGGLPTDVNADGKDDLLVTLPGNRPRFLRSKGDGTFSSLPIPHETYLDYQYSPPAVRRARFWWESVTPFNANSDSIKDLLTLEYDTFEAGSVHTRVFVRTGRRLGGFGPPTRLFKGLNIWNVGAGDLDGDGRMDVVARYDVQAVMVARGLKGGRFSRSFSVPIGASGRQMWVRDLNGDGLADLLFFDAVTGEITVLLNAVQ